jgi:hypothetical protein
MSFSCAKVFCLPDDQKESAKAEITDVLNKREKVVTEQDQLFS